MDCPKCDKEMVKAQATDYGETYDYCRSCKKEYKELIKIEEKPKYSNELCIHIWDPNADICLKCGITGEAQDFWTGSIDHYSLPSIHGGCYGGMHFTVSGAKACVCGKKPNAYP